MTSSTASSARWTRVSRRRTATSCPRSWVPMTCIALSSAKPAPTDAQIQALARQGRGVGPGRQDRRLQADVTGDVFRRRARALDRGPGRAEVDHEPERDRGRQLRQLRAVHPHRPGTTTARSCSSRTPTGAGHEADPDRARHEHDDGDCPGPGGLRGRRDRHGQNAGRRHPTGEGRPDPWPDGRRYPAALASTSTTTTTASIRRRSPRWLDAPNQRTVRR